VAAREEHCLMGFALLQAVGVSFAFIALVVAIIVVASVLYSAIKVVKEYERGVIFRLGRVQGGRRDRGSSCCGRSLT
jgi:regulator of protease activity HflC (stomatin/prohibitin superfamily)